MAYDVPSITLNGSSALSLPLLGFGTGAQSDDPQVITKAVICAIELGYRHFDTAAFYGTEEALGAGLAQAIKANLVTRSELFITSKLYSNMHDEVAEALKSSLGKLELEYLDLYLIHMPVKLKQNCSGMPREEDFLPLDLKHTWEGMEECLRLGLCRAIGVSNFSTKKLQDMMSYAKVLPAVNQVELHPVWQQQKLREYCRSVGIQIVGWSPLGGKGNFWGSSSVLENPVIQELATKYKKTPAQIVLRWFTKHGLGAVVKSYNPQRLQQNIQSFDFALSDDDAAKIDGITPQERLAKLEIICNLTTSPYKSVEELWDGEL